MSITIIGRGASTVFLDHRILVCNGNSTAWLTDNLFGCLLIDPPESTSGNWDALTWLREHDLWRLLDYNGSAIILTNPENGYIVLKKTIPMTKAVMVKDDSLKPYKDFQCPHVRPLAEVRRLLDMTTGAVCDPFCGTGTTLVACRDAGRMAIGMDKSLNAYNMTIARLSAETEGAMAALSDLGDGGSEIR